MKSEISIVKIGGNIISDKEKLHSFLSDFAKLEGKKILVHGGGKLATDLSEKLKIKTTIVDGRRITDAATLEVTTMVYSGLINKRLVAALQKDNCNAIGITGADANIIKAHKRLVKEIDYGFVGDINQVHTKNLQKLLEAGMVPVLCSITHDKKGQLLNTNADTIASEIAIALSNSYNSVLYYCFEKNGVLEDINDDTSLITHINKGIYQELIAKESIADGMLPKLHNCFHALENGVAKVCLGNEKMITDTFQVFTLLTL